LHQIHLHIENGGELVQVEDILGIMRPFCSDPSVPIHLRLKILQELEKAFALTSEDSELILLYRTQMIIASAWADLTVSHSDISDDASRHSLFRTLFSSCNSEAQCLVLSQLLLSWPPLSETTSEEEDPWYCLLAKLLQYTTESSMLSLLSLIRAWPSETPALRLNCLQRLRLHISGDCSKLYLLKFLLLPPYSELHDEAIQLINDNIPDDSYDTEVFDLLLQHHLVPKVVSSKIYDPLIQYILNQQQNEDIPSFSKVKSIASELKANGFMAEAGYLLLKNVSTPSALITFANSLKALNIWLR